MISKKTSEKTDGAVKLKAWYREILEFDGPLTAQKTLTRRTGRSWRAVESWMRGERRPDLESAKKLEVITENAVLVSDFYPELKS